MIDVPATPPTEEIYGRAKKINLELEKLPGHTHVAIVTMLKIMVEHRGVEEQTAHQNAQLKARQDAMAAAEQAAARAREDERIRAEKRAILSASNAAGIKLINTDAVATDGAKLTISQ